VGTRTSLVHGEEKILSPYRDSNYDPSVVQPVVSRYIDCAIPPCDITEIYIFHFKYTLALYYAFIFN
jgi:hypothetical protein